MMFNVVLDFLIFFIEVVLLNLVLNLIAAIIHIPPTPRNRIILAVIALFLAIILFWIKNIVYPPPICQASPDVADRLSTGENNLIIKNTPNEKDREEEIYKNNRDADPNNSYLLAVAVPGNARQQAARAMLAGVADAQTKFNQAQKDPTTPKKPSQPKLLKIVVVDDNDDKDIANKVACQIAENPKWKNILGVIGHHSSNASKAALEIYAKAGITMITPSSTSTNLKQDSNNKVFFRSTVSNAALGRSLADKIGTLGKVRIFYEGNNEYSKDLKNKFKEFLAPTLVEKEIDIQPSNFTESDVPPTPNYVKAAVFFSSGGTEGTNKRTISLIKKIRAENPRISLFGGDSLYEGLNLSIGKKDIEGLKLVFPWFPVDSEGKTISPYAKESQATWGGQINWVTASSYDATRAFLAAISKAEETSGKVERKSVLESLPNVVLEKEFTSGEKLKFQNGEVQGRQPVFVEVVQKEKLPKILHCSFEVCFKPVKN